MANDCQFCGIIAKHIAAMIVFEDENFIAFLDIRPLFLGHCLVVPKMHYINLYDLPNMLVKELFVNVKKIGKAIERATQAQGSFIAINNTVSQSVPHLHVHIVPRNKGDGLKGFFWPRTKYKNEEEINEIRLKIIKFLAE